MTSQHVLPTSHVYAPMPPVAPARRRRVVLIQGAFEILHVGHVRAFREARKQGDYLIVALNSNELIKQYKGRDAVMAWEDKKEILRSLRDVSQVVEARTFSPLALLEIYDVDVYMVADEWESGKSAEKEYMLRKGGRVCVMPRFAASSTTEIKDKLLAEHADRMKKGAAMLLHATGPERYRP